MKLFPCTKPEKLFNVVFIMKKERILLGYKKRGFGEGKWNGFGGKVEKNESITASALRELKEESNLTIDKLTRRGILYFEFQEGPQNLLKVHVFTGDGDQIQEDLLAESEEMRPKWFQIDDIPYDKMWQDDRLWFPLLLDPTGKLFFGHFRFKNSEEINDYKIQEVSSFDNEEEL